MSALASASSGLLWLRVCIGAMMLYHGWPKLQKLLSGDFQFPDPLGMGAAGSLASAVGAEVICSVLLIIGLLTRLAAAPLAFTMVIAAMVIHANDGYDIKEKALLFLVVYVALIFTGPGQFSVDHLIWGKRAAKEPGSSKT